MTDKQVESNTIEEALARYEKEFGKEAQSTSMLDLVDYHQCLHEDIKEFIAKELQTAIDKSVEEERTK